MIGASREAAQLSSHNQSIKGIIFTLRFNLYFRVDNRFVSDYKNIDEFRCALHLFI